MRTLVRTRTALVAGAALHLASTAGCGPIAAAVVLGTGASSSSGGAVPNTPPVLDTVAVSSATPAGVVAVSFRAADVQANAVNVVVEVQVPGGSFETASPEAGSPGLTALATSPEGKNHVFRWDSRKDTGPRDLSAVQLRLTPFDSDRGTAATVALAVANNEAPEVQLLRTSSDGSGTGFLDYILSDSGADVTDVTVEFSLDGGLTFAPATRATSAPGDGVSGLATTPTGRIYSFAWDGRHDAPGVRNGNVVFRLTPRDAKAGEAKTLGGLSIDNSSPPRVSSVAASVAGNVVDFTYVVADAESDPVSVALTFTEGGPVQAATNVSAVFPDASLSGLRSSPGGAAHVLRWDAIQLGVGTHTVVATITPRDTLPGSSGTVGVTLTVSGNGPPSASLGAVSRQVGVSTVAVPLAAQDPDGDAVSVVASFSVGAAGPFTAHLVGQPATIATPSSTILVWDARTDLTASGFPGSLVQGIVLSVALSDGRQTGPTAQTSAFTFGNEAPRVESASQPPDGSSGVVPLAFALSDSTQDPATVRAEFRFAEDPDVAMSYRPIAVAVGTLSGLATSTGAPGTTHSVGWDTKAALAASPSPGGIGLDNRRVVVRYVPDDGLAAGAGVAVETSAFLVQNNLAPNATVGAITRASVPGPTTIPFTVFNAEGAADPCTIKVEFSTDGASFQTATGIAGLATFVGTASGASYSVTWDATAQLGTSPVTTGVVVKVTPRDSIQDGTPGTSAPFTVGNDVPDLQVPGFTGPQSGKVTFALTLRDTSSDPAFLAFAIKVDGSPLTSPHLTAGPTTAFPTDSVTPIGYQVVWDAPADVPAINGNAISVTITPTDAFGGTPVPRTLGFTLASSDQQPVVTFPAIPRQDTDTVSFGLGVQDAEGSDVKLEGFDLDPGTGSFTGALTVVSPALPATVMGTASATTQTVVWNARADLGQAARTGVRIRARFKDLGSGVSFSKAMSAQEAFVYGNDAPVVEAITVPSGTSSGNVVLTVRLSDTTSDAADLVDAGFGNRVLVRWTDRGTGVVTTSVAVIATGVPVTGLAASPAGVSHVLVWDSVATIGSKDADCVLLLQPSDKGHAPAPGDVGVLVTSAGFMVHNNSPPDVIVNEPTGNPDSDGPFAVQFLIRDAEGDPADVLLQWGGDRTSFPSVTDLLSDPVARARVFGDPDECATRRIITPYHRPVLEARCLVSAVGSVTTVTLCNVTPAECIPPRLVGTTLELLSDGGGIEQARTIVAVDPRNRRVELAPPLDAPPRSNQRAQVVENRASSFGSLATSAAGLQHDVAWDVPTDAGVSGEGTPGLFVVANAAAGEFAGTPWVTQLPKPSRVYGFQPRTNPTTSSYALSVIASDLNGDGRLDLVSANTTFSGAGFLLIALQRPDGTFPSPPTKLWTGSPNSTGCVIAVDLNGDGSLDLVSTTPRDGTLLVFSQLPGGTFSAPVTLATGAFPSWVIAADLDRDGRLDLVSADSGSNALSIFPGSR